MAKPVQNATNAEHVQNAADSTAKTGDQVDKAGQSASQVGNAAQNAGNFATGAGDFAKTASAGLAGGATAVTSGAAKKGLEVVQAGTEKGMGMLNGLIDKGMGILDGLMPPEKREELTRMMKKWGSDNPAMAIFSLPQVVLAGLPLFLFWFFTILIFILALVLALLIALLLTVIFIVGSILVAVFVVLPLMFGIAFAGIFLALWGLMIYKFVFPKLQLKEKAEEAKKLGREAMKDGKTVLGMNGSQKRRPRRNQTVSTEDGKKMDLPNVPRGEPAPRPFQAKEGATRRRIKKKPREGTLTQNGAPKPAPKTKKKQPMPAS